MTNRIFGTVYEVCTWCKLDIQLDMMGNWIWNAAFPIQFGYEMAISHEIGYEHCPSRFLQKHQSSIWKELFHVFKQTHQFSRSGPK